MPREALFASEQSRDPENGVILFRVAEVNLARALVGADPDNEGWSDPVRFRFQWRDDQTFDMIVKRAKP